MTSSSATIYYVQFDAVQSGLVGHQELAQCDRGAILPENDKPEIESPPLRRMTRKKMGEMYTAGEVASLFDVSEGRLRYWDRSGFLSPAGQDGKKKRYTFADLVAVRSAVTLLERGVSLQKVRKLVATLREKMPIGTHPVSTMRIMSDDKTVIIAQDECEYEAHTGQLLMDFKVEIIEEAVVTKLPNREEGAEKSAFDWYLEGCSLDEDEHTFAAAEQAYHQAIHLDPSLANAYTNLGNLLFRSGASDDARALYEKATEVDPRQSEAQYNLGYLEFEDGYADRARKRFIQAVQLDPDFADAHYNLAMALFRLGKEDDAVGHLETYLNLEPAGPWAELARQRLSESS